MIFRSARIHYRACPEHAPEGGAARKYFLSAVLKAVVLKKKPGNGGMRGNNAVRFYG